MSTASKATTRKTQGVVKVTRKSATGSVGQHTFSSPKIDWITVYNASDVDVAINFDDFDATLTTHYRTIKPGVETQPIGITQNTTMEYMRLSGSGSKRIEITMWG